MLLAAIRANANTIPELVITASGHFRSAAVCRRAKSSAVILTFTCVVRFIPSVSSVKLLMNKDTDSIIGTMNGSVTKLSLNVVLILTAAAVFGQSQSAKWSRFTERSPLDDSKTVILSVAGEGPIEGWPKKIVIPKLVVRCQEKRTQVYVDTEMAANPEIGDGFTVRLRLGQSQATTQLWGESTSKDSLFSPEPIALTRQLLTVDRLLFQFTPYNSTPTLAEFDVRGLSRLIGELASSCGWSTEEDTLRVRLDRFIKIMEELESVPVIEPASTHGFDSNRAFIDLVKSAGIEFSKLPMPNAAGEQNVMQLADEGLSLVEDVSTLSSEYLKWAAVDSKWKSGLPLGMAGTNAAITGVVAKRKLSTGEVDPVFKDSPKIRVVRLETILNLRSSIESIVQALKEALAKMPR